MTKIAIHQKMKLPIAFKTNPPMKAMLPINTFINPTTMNRINTVMKRPANKVIIPKINSTIIFLSFLFRIKIENFSKISKFYLDNEYKKVTQGTLKYFKL